MRQRCGYNCLFGKRSQWILQGRMGVRPRNRIKHQEACESESLPISELIWNGMWGTVASPPSTTRPGRRFFRCQPFSSPDDAMPGPGTIVPFSDNGIRQGEYRSHQLCARKGRNGVSEETSNLSHGCSYQDELLLDVFVCRSSCDMSKVKEIHGGDVQHDLIFVKIKNNNDHTVAGPVHLRPASPLYRASTRPRSTRMETNKQTWTFSSRRMFEYIIIISLYQFYTNSISMRS